MMQGETTMMTSSAYKMATAAASSSMTSEARMQANMASESKMTAESSSEARVARRSSFSRVSTSEMAAQEAVEYHQKHVRASSQERYLSRYVP